MELPNNKKKTSIIVIIIIDLIAFAVIAGGIGYYYYSQFNQLKANPQTLSANQTKQIVAEVSQLIQLPADETPQIATVVNPSLVQTHTPFAQAETGDVILIYSRMKRAILYRPGVHKLIDVAPVIIGTPTPTLAPTAIPTEKISLMPTSSVKAKLFITTTPK